MSPTNSTEIQNMPEGELVGSSPVKAALDTNIAEPEPPPENVETNEPEPEISPDAEPENAQKTERSQSLTDVPSKKSTPESNSGSNSSRSSAIADDSKASALIKKQMNEIEKEINRRIQNKNIKKVSDRKLVDALVH